MTETSLLLPIQNEKEKLANAQRFYRDFKDSSDRPRLIFGFNRYASEIIRQFRIDGIIDDFTERSHIESLPVLRSNAIPKNALVISLSGGRPLSVRRHLASLDVEHLDYFTFRKIAAEDLCPIHFNEGFEVDFAEHVDKYQWVHSILIDETSRQVFKKLVNFRLQYDLDFLEGFTHREPEQYFESFLALTTRGESFADIGAFDGHTSKMFIEHCPEYAHIHLFEPDPKNLANAREKLAAFHRLNFHPIGLSNSARILKLNAHGSGSTLSEEGDTEIAVDRLDDVTSDDFTFIKIDIEGAELEALEGARRTIERSHPRIAVAVYHCSENTGPFWQIPEKILSIRQDYDVYLRHYTESIYETVMFFMPRVDQ